jgi:branched-chain amino acid transport system ATP-binding protein
LAPLVVESIYESVERITAEHGCAVVLVEQHVTVALDVADRAAVLNRGSIVLEGAASDLAHRVEDLELAYFGTEAPLDPS